MERGVPRSLVRLRRKGRQTGQGTRRPAHLLRQIHRQRPVALQIRRAALQQGHQQFCPRAQEPPETKTVVIEDVAAFKCAMPLKATSGSRSRNSSEARTSKCFIYCTHNIRNLATNIHHSVVHYHQSHSLLLFPCASWPRVLYFGFCHAFLLYSCELDVKVRSSISNVNVANGGMTGG